jgi:uroporphyrinogen decarboxylase
MTPKERVLTAVAHKDPDRCPCDYIGTPEVDEKLKAHFGTESMDVVLERLGVDLRVVDAPYVGPELRVWDDGRFENYWGSIRKPVRNEAGTYNEAVELPYASFKSVEDVEKFRWPKVEWFDYSQLVEDCGKYSDYAIVFGEPGNMDLINGTAYGRGVEQVIYDIALEDPVGLACMEKRFECCYERSEQGLKAGNGRIDILWIGDMLHSCGSTRPLWSGLIEAGVDIYQTVQPEARDMDPAELKAEFGDRMCLHGTISIQKTLPFGTPEDVAAEVRQRIETAGKNGGLIVAPAHNTQPDTPIENILALYETVQQS